MPSMLSARSVRSPWRIGLLSALLLAVCSCTETASVFPLNDAAKKIGDPKVEFVRQGIDRGPVTITMPDGEVLKGEYQVARNGAIAMGFSGAQTATGLAVGSGGVQFVVTGPRTRMLCRGSVSLGGHGNGECQTVDGATWAINY